MTTWSIQYINPTDGSYFAVGIAPATQAAVSAVQPFLFHRPEP